MIIFLILIPLQEREAATTHVHQMRTVEDAQSVISGPTEDSQGVHMGGVHMGTTRKVLNHQLATVSAALWILTAEATHTASN